MISDNQRLIEPRPTEIENSLSDINKAKNLLLWKPKVELEDWINQQKELL
jgi:GDP-D-mannose dehydratase